MRFRNEKGKPYRLIIYNLEDFFIAMLKYEEWVGEENIILQKIGMWVFVELIYPCVPCVYRLVNYVQTHTENSCSNTLLCMYGILFFGPVFILEHGNKEILEMVYCYFPL